MRQWCWKRALLEVACAAATSGAVAATSGGSYSIDSSVIAAGGATLSGGAFRLEGTVAQPATSRLSAAGFSLYTGFWAPEEPASDRIFANGFDP
jgi:hypothetical protein